MNLNRWESLCKELNLNDPENKRYHHLISLYAQENRIYHNLDHIEDCLQEFQNIKEKSENPLSLELALFYHDSIYNPNRGVNEEKSAILAYEDIIEMNQDYLLAQRVANLIIYTKHNSLPLEKDGQLIMDIDIAIFGKKEELFWDYERKIRTEYSWIKNEIFNLKRIEILEKFLSRNTIYLTPEFIEKYETQARKNLTASINKLRTAD